MRSVLILKMTAFRILASSSIQLLSGQIPTIEVQPLSTGEYILTLDSPILWDADFTNSQETSLVIDGVFGSEAGQGSASAQALGEHTLFGVSYGQSTEVAGQEGIVDRADFVLLAGADTFFFDHGALTSELGRFRIIIQPLPGLDNLSGGRTVFLSQGEVSTETVVVNFVQKPVLTISPIITPVIKTVDPNKRFQDNFQLQLQLQLTGNNQDLELQSSTDLSTWSPLGFFLPQEDSIEFPIVMESDHLFYRLAPSYSRESHGPAVTDILTVAGLTIETGQEDQHLYQYLADGTGQLAYLFGTDDVSYHLFTWTEISGPGYTTVSIQFPSDGTQHHFIRAYQSLDPEAPEHIYTNYVSTFDAEEIPGIGDSSTKWQARVSTQTPPSSALVGKTWTLTSVDFVSIYDFQSATELTSRNPAEGPDGIPNDPVHLNYEFTPINDTSSELRITHPNGVSGTYSVTFSSATSNSATYSFESDDGVFGDSGTITQSD
ncbi:hypothetical protein N9F44_02305 [Akkermansiaceae bacterium]|nr:hypothetical protein [Akkermansiaceae bacterium]MDA8975821.1 hypothetical protein [Akkermansiaceae bacterium]MDB4412253.1 hypothetical protein [Akkermansiaceae bacterium]MDB4421790.1 hypothetical protein [Akkermansiaceae bacterium]MDB4458138.1 hypothetical protein [Akkermansiaceae bacterium]